MPIQACVNRVNVCTPCNDTPIENLSAEAPDAATYLGLFFGVDQAILGDLYSTLGCLNWCWSGISQQDADDCARQQEELCTGTDAAPYDGGRWSPIVGDGYQQRGMFASWQQTCSILCPDGSTFTYILPPAAVRSGVSREHVEALAHSLCLKRARENRFCCDFDFDGCCKDSPVAEALLVTGGVAPFTFSIVSGSLPDGLTLSADGVISGTPTTVGAFSAVLRVTDSSGHTCDSQQTFTCRVVEITTATPLTTAWQTDAYSVALAASAGAISPLKWTIASGAPPDDLVLDPATGVLSGNADDSGVWDPTIVFTFTVQLEDEQ